MNNKSDLNILQVNLFGPYNTFGSDSEIAEPQIEIVLRKHVDYDFVKDDVCENEEVQLVQRMQYKKIGHLADNYEMFPSDSFQGHWLVNARTLTSVLKKYENKGFFIYKIRICNKILSEKALKYRIKRNKKLIGNHSCFLDKKYSEICSKIKKRKSYSLWKEIKKIFAYKKTNNLSYSNNSALK